MTNPLNISAEDKLNKYLEFNPDFTIYRPLEVTPPPVTPYVEERDSRDEIMAIDENIRKRSISNVPNEFIPSKVDDEKPIVGISNLEKIKDYVNKANTYETSYPNIARMTMGKYTGPGDLTTLRNQIAKSESEGQGDYQAVNKTKGSTATGRYQFIWGKDGKVWGDSIMRKTGVKSRQEFLNNPKAQDDFFNFYAQDTLVPQMKIIKKEFPNSGLTDMDIMKLLHFRGLGKSDKSSGLRNILANGLMHTKLESNNSTAFDYLKTSNK